MAIQPTFEKHLFTVHTQYLFRVKDVTRENLQLLGVTCFLVASKLHEPHSPHPDDCAYWTDFGTVDSFISSSDLCLIQ